MSDTGLYRCSWTGHDLLMVAYHDNEWGKPVHDDCILFEFLVLEGAQAGLSWQTILRKRAEYRRAMDNFNFKKIARYTGKDVARLMSNKGIVRNRLKINSVITNAKKVLETQKEFGSFDQYIWRFADAKTMSKSLKKRGFTFVGETICYAFMQATGMVNDHEKKCFLYSK